MDTVSRLIVGTWVVGAGGQAIAAAALTRSGMFRRYPIITVSLGMAAFIHGYTLSELYSGGWRAYTTAWRQVQPLEAGLMSAMVMEAIYTISRHFPRSRTLSAVLLAIVGVVSMLAVAPGLGAIAPPLSGWLATVAEPLLQRRNWTICLLVLVAVCRVLLFRLEPEPRENATRYVTAALIALGASVVGDVTIRAGLGYWWNAVGQFMLGIPPLASLWLWGAMSPAGEAYSPTWDARLAEDQADGAMLEFQEKARRAAAGRD